MKSRLQTGVSSDLKKRIKEEFEKLYLIKNADRMPTERKENALRGHYKKQEI